MSKRKWLQGLVVCCVMMVAGGNWEVMAARNENSAYMTENSFVTVEGQKESRAAQLVWYYKQENGKKYRRLYDATNQKWLTDWILC